VQSTTSTTKVLNQLQRNIADYLKSNTPNRCSISASKRLVRRRYFPLILASQNNGRWQMMALEVERRAPTSAQ
jgi:hypothetical protein